MDVGTILGILLFLLIFLVVIPYVLYISTKNEFGGGMYNKSHPKNIKQNKKS